MAQKKPRCVLRLDGQAPQIVRVELTYTSLRELDQLAASRFAMPAGTRFEMFSESGSLISNIGEFYHLFQGTRKPTLDLKPLAAAAPNLTATPPKFKVVTMAGRSMMLRSQGNLAVDVASAIELITKHYPDEAATYAGPSEAFEFRRGSEAVRHISEVVPKEALSLCPVSVAATFAPSPSAPPAAAAARDSSEGTSFSGLGGAGEEEPSKRSSSAQQPQMFSPPPPQFLPSYPQPHALLSQRLPLGEGLGLEDADLRNLSPDFSHIRAVAAQPTDHPQGALQQQLSQPTAAAAATATADAALAGGSGESLLRAVAVGLFQQAARFPHSPETAAILHSLATADLSAWPQAVAARTILLGRLQPLLLRAPPLATALLASAATATAAAAPAAAAAAFGDGEEGEGEGEGVSSLDDATGSDVVISAMERVDEACLVAVRAVLSSYLRRCDAQQQLLTHINATAASAAAAPAAAAPASSPSFVSIAQFCDQVVDPIGFSGTAFSGTGVSTGTGSHIPTLLAALSRALCVRIRVFVSGAGLRLNFPDRKAEPTLHLFLAGTSFHVLYPKVASVDAASLRAQIHSAQTDLEEMDAENDERMANIQDLELTCQQLRAEAAAQQQQLSALQQQLSTQQQQNQELLAQREQQQQVLRQHAIQRNADSAQLAAVRAGEAELVERQEACIRDLRAKLTETQEDLCDAQAATRAAEAAAAAATTSAAANAAAADSAAGAASTEALGMLRTLTSGMQTIQQQLQGSGERDARTAALQAQLLEKEHVIRRQAAELASLNSTVAVAFAAASHSRPSAAAAAAASARASPSFSASSSSPHSGSSSRRFHHSGHHHLARAASDPSTSPSSFASPRAPSPHSPHSLIRSGSPSAAAAGAAAPAALAHSPVASQSGRSDAASGGGSHYAAAMEAAAMEAAEAEAQAQAQAQAQAEPEPGAAHGHAAGMAQESGGAADPPPVSEQHWPAHPSQHGANGGSGGGKPLPPAAPAPSRFLQPQPQPQQPYPQPQPQPQPQVQVGGGSGVSTGGPPSSSASSPAPPLQVKREPDAALAYLRQ